MHLSEAEARWQDAILAAACLMVDGHALGGLRLKAPKKIASLKDMTYDQVSQSFLR